MHTNGSIDLVEPNNFDSNNHYYERVRNAFIHPLVKYFLGLSNERIVDRYCHLHPEVDKQTLSEMLNYQPSYFKWSGADLFPVSTNNGIRKMVLIETNSCPSGQKSMPLFEDSEERGSYRELLETSFLPTIKDLDLPEGKLAVIYDKNEMEASGYAATLADLTQEKVYLVQYYNEDNDPPVRFIDGILQIRENENWVPIRAAFKYVTQKPWNRIPIKTKTYIYNPIVCCLAGGRNKLVASKAYEFLNGDLEGTGLGIRTPETYLDLSKNEISYWVQKLGGFAVIKVPYSNAGQGVYTITNPNELNQFMEADYDYDIFIVQSLIGNSKWSSVGKSGRLYHIGTVPDKKKRFYVADLRMMICSTKEGYRPITTYARRARVPLADKIGPEDNSWDMLGTNLSIKQNDGWGSDTDRLLLMDQRDFNKLGIGLDDLIEAFIQTVLASISIDKMSTYLLNSDGNFKLNLFRSLDTDDSLIGEIKLE